MGVPGEVMGFYREWQKFGRVAWASLFEPTIKLCEDGHLVNVHMDRGIKGSEEIIRNDTNLRLVTAAVLVFAKA